MSISLPKALSLLQQSSVCAHSAPFVDNTFRPTLAAAIMLCCLMLCLTGRLTAQAYTPQQPSAPRPASPEADDPFRRSIDDEFHDPHLEVRRRISRETERQRQMVECANRLVTLTARYRGNVQIHGEPTAEDLRLLTEIEKLARSVKDHMRGM